MLLLALVVIVNMGPGLVVPLMPILLKDYGFSTQGLSVAFFAILFARFLAQRYGGRAVSRLGAHRVLAVGLSLYVVTMAIYPLVDGREAFIALRFLEGIFEGLAVVSLNDLAVAMSDKERRGRQMGLFGAAYGLGLILGPVMGGVLYEYVSMAAVFWGTSTVAAVGTLLLLLSRSAFVVPRPPAAAAAAPRQRLADMIFGETGRLLAYYQPYILRRVLFFSLQMILPLSLYGRFGVPAGEVGLYFALSAILSTSIMPFSGRLADRVDPRRLLAITLVIMGVSIAMFGLAPTLPLFLTLFVIETLAFCFMLPTAMKVFSDLVAEHPRRGEILGSFGSLVDLSCLLTPFVVLPLFEVSEVAAWGVLAVMCLGAALPFVFVRPTTPAPTDTPAT
jgi:DHA1 family multidrug resistance protein-like MFS transporter